MRDAGMSELGLLVHKASSRPGRTNRSLVVVQPVEAVEFLLVRWFRPSDRRRLARWSQLKNITLDQFLQGRRSGPAPIIFTERVGSCSCLTTLSGSQDGTSRNISRGSFEDHIAVHEGFEPFLPKDGRQETADVEPSAVVRVAHEVRTLAPRRCLEYR